MPSKPRIGLLSPFFKPISAYEQPAWDLNLELVVVTPSRIDWKTHQVRGLVWNGQAWIDETVPFPQALYNRYYGSKPKVVSRLENIIGRNRVFNHITRFDKWVLHQILAKSDLKKLLPSTDVFTAKGLINYMERFGQVIVKPDAGQLGTRIYLVVKDGDFHLHYGTKSPIASFSSKEDLLSRLEPMVNKGFLLQRYIPLASVDGRAFDLRFLVQKNRKGVWQVSGMLSRLALRYSYITNVSQAIVRVEETLTKAFPQKHLVPQLQELSIKGAQIAEESLGSLGELSVDFGLDQDGRIWIIELNAKPMKSIFQALDDTQLMQEIYRQPLCYALHLATT